MMEFKYVVMIDQSGKESIHIFPKSFNHDCMAEAIGAIKDTLKGGWNRLRLKPISAGFTDLRYYYGFSESLGLSSRGNLDINLLDGLTE